LRLTLLSAPPSSEQRQQRSCRRSRRAWTHLSGCRIRMCPRSESIASHSLGMTPFTVIWVSFNSSRSTWVSCNQPCFGDSISTETRLGLRGHPRREKDNASALLLQHDPDRMLCTEKSGSSSLYRSAIQNRTVCFPNHRPNVHHTHHVKQNIEGIQMCLLLSASAFEPDLPGLRRPASLHTALIGR